MNFRFFLIAAAALAGATISLGVGASPAFARAAPNIGVSSAAY